MNGRVLTLDGQTAPPVLVALRVAADVRRTVGQADDAGRLDRILEQLTDRWCSDPTDVEAHAAVDRLISGFEDDHDARVYLTDLVRMLALAAPTEVHRWASRMVESRAAR